MKQVLGILSIVLLLTLPTIKPFAEPGSLPYQGTLRKDGQLYTGIARLKFAILDGTTVIWSSDEVDKQTGIPRGSVPVTVTSGDFSVLLGTSPMRPLDVNELPGHPGASVRVWVSTGGPFEQLSDQAVASADKDDCKGNEKKLGEKKHEWSLRGNRETNPDCDVLGTTDNQPLIMVTNSLPVLTLGTDGPVEVHKPIAFHDDATAEQNLHVGGELSAARGVSLTGALALSGDATIGGDLAVAGSLTAGTVQASGLAVSGDASCKTLTILGGADLAEPFQVDGADAVAIEPGMVVSIDSEHPGRLRLASNSYDQSVAGVVSGAGGISPGMVMNGASEHGSGSSCEVALAGRVYVHASACNGAIEPGDRLTTSSLAGHAMKATNRGRARGSVIGKAMSRLESGTGLVLMLVQPQ